MTEIKDSIEVTKVSAPPYISFRTLLNLIERMADQGIPRRIDRSYLTGLSGGYQTQVMAALRGLGWIDDEGGVQQRLVDLVTHPAERQALLAQTLRERYPEAVRLGAANATQGELEEAFRPSGIGGATLRKAVAFYLHAAEFAGIQVSPFFKTPNTSSDGNTPRRRKTRAVATKPTPDPIPLPLTDSATPEQLKARYIEMLLKRVEDQDDMDDKLLDRIEMLLGFEAQREEGEPKN